MKVQMKQELKKDTNERPKCGLCGKTSKLTKTECCDNWICDDSHKYVLFSYARNSCFRNHDHYTICSFHFNEGHPGKWQDCKICRNSFETELYVDMATNDYNFEKLKNPPKYKPTKCSKCEKVIILADGGYSIKGGKYFCYNCTETKF